MTAPVLYGLSRSVYTRIARLAFHEKRIEYSFEEVEIFGSEGVPRAHFERHPFGRIPTLHHDGFTLYETGAITRYIDEEFSGVPLQPTSTRARARMNQVISVLDAYAYYPMIWSVFVQRISIPKSGTETDEAIISEALPRIDTCLTALDNLLGPQRCFAGDAISLADLHAAPMLLYFSLTAEGRRMLTKYADLSRWLSEVSQRRSIDETKSVYE